MRYRKWMHLKYSFTGGGRKCENFKNLITVVNKLLLRIPIY